MRLQFPLLFPIALGACLVASLVAQERAVKQPQPAALGVIDDLDVIITDLTAEKLNNPPKREIKVGRLEEPLKRKLTKPDPKLFEQKYVSTFRLETPASGKRYAPFLRDKEDGDVAQLQFIGDIPLLFSQISSSSGMAGMSGMPDGGMAGMPSGAGGMPGMPGRTYRPPGESFKRMTKFLPPGEPLAKEELVFFANPQTMGGMLSFSIYQDRERGVTGGWAFFVLGATPEEAERRAKALLTLLDQGAFRPIQLEIFKKREPLSMQLRDQRTAVEATQRSMNATQEELKAYADFTPDMLSILRVQQLQLDVDLAGVKARIAACERLLAQPTLKADRRNQIEDLKVAAEIEFSGFEARRTKSDEFIGKVKTKIDLLSKHSTVESEQSNARNKIGRLEVQIKNLDEAIRAYAPLPLVDNKVVVQPLEWTQ